MNAGNTFSAYKTRDLENFEGPYTVFDGGKTGFWADRDFWAPEVHKYEGRYYLLGSFKAEGKRRATQILVADDPLGPFSPLTESPITPAAWECLDGTLWVENGVPYLVFCHEWVQTENGEMCALRLTPDLKAPAGEPFVLFKAGDNPAVDGFEGCAGRQCRITDGPFLFREDGKLKMIWSSLSGGKYAVLEAEADALAGEWKHGGSRFAFDGGHAMLFEDFWRRKAHLVAPSQYAASGTGGISAFLRRGVTKSGLRIVFAPLFCPRTAKFKFYRGFCFGLRLFRSDGSILLRGAAKARTFSPRFFPRTGVLFRGA